MRDTLCCHIPVAISFHSAIPLFWGPSETLPRSLLWKVCASCSEALLALWGRTRERRIFTEAFYNLFESRFRHLGTCLFKASAPAQKEFIKKKPPLQGQPEIQRLKIRFPQAQALQLWCVLSPSTSRMSGGDVQTDAPLTPGRFLDIANKENFHIEFAERAWRHHREALDCRKLHR
jgi:hypothetical protein